MSKDYRTETLPAIVLIHRCLLCSAEEEFDVRPSLYRDDFGAPVLNGFYSEEAPRFVYDDPKYDTWHTCADGRRGRRALVGERRGSLYVVDFQHNTIRKADS